MGWSLIKVNSGGATFCCSVLLWQWTASASLQIAQHLVLFKGQPFEGADWIYTNKQRLHIYNSPTLDVAADLSWVVVWWRQISTNIMGLTLVTHSISAPNGVPKSNIIRARRDDPTRQSPMSQLIMTIYSMILVAIFATYGHNQQIKW